MSIFFRLFHLSDLHFGDTWFTPWWGVSHHIAGLETHSARTATALHDSVRYQHLLSDVASRVIATGDLTTWGTPEAFSLASEFLIRNVAGAKNRGLIGLNDPFAAVMPGNHDTWSGVLKGMPVLGGSSAAVRKQFFHSPAADARTANSKATFPYRVCLHQGSPTRQGIPTVHLYALDSTRLDAKDRPRSGARHALPGDWGNVLADGYVDEQQLADLRKLVASESRDEKILRIAALHHPLGYAEGDDDPKMKVLLNRDQVVSALQELGFAVALCGHQHRGFVGQVGQNDQKTPLLYVLSVSTATQTVSAMTQAISTATRWFQSARQRLEAVGGKQSIQGDIETKARALANQIVIGNEYRIYEFDYQDDEATVGVTVYSYEYDRELKRFSMNDPLRCELALNNYQPR